MRDFQSMPAVALLLLGCMRAAAAAQPSAADFAGKWNVTANFTEESAAAVLTLSQSGGQFKGASSGLDARPTFALPGNTQTGPFYIDGAMPGDTLVVTARRASHDRRSPARA